MALTNRFARDVFHSLRTKKAAEATIAVLSSVQDRSAEEIIAGLSAAFLLVTEKYGITPQDAFQATANMMKHHDARGGHEFDAARMFLSDDVFVSGEPSL